MCIFVGGLSIYRRSLKRDPSDAEREKKLQRSRQQRVKSSCSCRLVCYYNYFKVWDRRAKYVSAEEMEKWGNICPTMMSDEETVDSKRLKRRRPIWRSPEFNSFMDVLDRRYESAAKHPTKERICGSPLNNAAPAKAKEWMISTQDDKPDSPVY